MKRIFILLLALSSCICGFSQDCQDTTYASSFQELITIIHANHTNRIIQYSDSLLDELKSAGLQKCEFFYYTKFHKGQGLELNNQIDEAVALYHDIIPRCQKLSFHKVEAEAFLSLARIYEHYNRPKDCLRNLERALEIIQEHQLEDILSRYAVRYASYQRIYENKSVAREYATKAIQLGEKHNVHRSIVDGSLLAGILSEDKDSSIYYFEKAELRFINSRSYVSASLMAINQARELIDAEEYQKAKVVLNRALDHQQIAPTEDPLYYLGLSLIYNLKETIALSEENIDSAYVYAKKSGENDALVEMDADQQKINELEINFAIEQEKARSQSIRLITKILIVGFAIFILLSGILALYYFRLRIRNDLIVKQSNIINTKNDKLIASNKEKELLLSEIHHRVKNNLQLVISLLTMYARNFKDQDLKDHFEGVSEKVMSISLIHEQLYKNEDFEEINMPSYFNELKEKFEVLHFNDNFKITVDCEDINFNIDTVMPIGIITTELINNSIKYSDKEKKYLELCLKLKRQDELYIFTYKDNGPGYPTGKLDTNGKRIGSFLINSMVRQILAESRSYNDNGAVFEMIFVEKLASPV